MLSIVGRLSLVTARNRLLIRLAAFLDVFALLNCPVYVRSHQNYLTDMLNQLPTRTICLPLFTQVLDFLKLFQVELPLLLKRLVSELLLRIEVDSSEIVL
jgi:hypothetical protein